MKTLLTGIAVLLVFASLPGRAADVDMSGQYDETHQQNQSYNQPVSSMSNVQINPWGNAHDYYGDGVSCSKPSVNIGVAGGENPHRTMAYASINIPLGSKDCKKVANTRRLTMEYELRQLKAEQRKADVLFSAKMANMCLEIHQHVEIQADNALYAECAQYVKTQPEPDELAEISAMWERYSGRTNQLEGRVGKLERVAHLPDESTLLWNTTGNN